jgi:hypothetical protein
MKQRRLAWLAILVVVVFALLFSYSSSVRGPKPGRIIIARDVSDAASINFPKGKAGNDPYFDHVNYPGTIVFAGTNAITPASR